LTWLTSELDFYAREDGNKFFKCILTQHAPQTKGGWALHPLQRRIFTVRELARAQGFPDNYVFLSTEDKISAKVKDVSFRAVIHGHFLISPE
jgi:DNA (cytosine-5)-methyltransferase 1